MSAPRRRKTPETDVANTIRTYAATYAASGEKDYARGLLDAANMVDDLLSRARRLGLEPPTAASASASVEERLLRLERLMRGLLKEGGFGRASTGPNEMPARLVTFAPTGKLNGAEDPKRLRGRALRIESEGGRSVEPTSALQPGEERTLAAIAQRGEVGASTDELVAMVAYRTTSVAKYLGNLRAGAYVTSAGGRHRATADGKTRVEGHAEMPIGPRLCARWIGGDLLCPGEQVLLRAIAEHPNPLVDVASLFGERTGLQMTSVQKYLGQLRRQRLVVRPKPGQVALAPILRSSA